MAQWIIQKETIKRSPGIVPLSCSCVCQNLLEGLLVCWNTPSCAPPSVWFSGSGVGPTVPVSNRWCWCCWSTDHTWGIWLGNRVGSEVACSGTGVAIMKAMRDQPTTDKTKQIFPSLRGRVFCVTPFITSRTSGDYTPGSFRVSITAEIHLVEEWCKQLPVEHPVLYYVWL